MLAQQEAAYQQSLEEDLRKVCLFLCVSIA